MSWSREQVIILIEEYMKYPCLYAVKTKNYLNKRLRQEALDEIEKAVKVVKPSVTINDIKLKFNGLKATFLAEHRKYLNSICSGTEFDRVYQPNLWYYEKFKFILDHVESRQSVDSINPSQLQEVAEEFIEEQVVTDMDEYIIDENGTPHLSESNKENSVENTSVYNTSKRKRNEDNDMVKEATNVLKSINKTISRPRSEVVANCSDDVALANFIICKLKQITREDVKIEVEENIAHILFDRIKKM